MLRIAPRRGVDEILGLYAAISLRGGVIAGGYARYMCSPSSVPRPYTDVDIFSYNETCYEALEMHFRSSEGIQIAHTNEISTTFDVSNCPEYKQCPNINLISPKVRKTSVTVGSEVEILDSFDFTVCRAAVISPNEVLVDDNFLADESKGEIRFHKIRSPIGALFRVIKYVEKGYKLPWDEAFKLMESWDTVSPQNKTLIKDYLGGKLGGAEAQKEFEHAYEILKFGE